MNLCTGAGMAFDGTYGYEFRPSSGKERISINAVEEDVFFIVNF